MLEGVSFQALLAGLAQLSPDQQEQVRRFLDEQTSELDAVLALLEALVGPDRRCPHCQATRAQKPGKANGLTRYYGTMCRKTFNALTGSRLARLKHREQWAPYARCLLQGLTLREAADACEVHPETAHRWRHRFMGTSARQHRRTKIGGVIESDDALIRHSEKGCRVLDRKPRKRGGTKGPGAKEHIHALVSYSRDGEILFHVLKVMAADGVRYSLSHNLKSGTVLVTDSAKCFSTAACQMGIAHIKLNISAGQRTRGIDHIQNVNNIHRRLRDFLAHYRGVASKYLENYLEWFRRIELKKVGSAIVLLHTIFSGIRTVNA